MENKQTETVPGDIELDRKPTFLAIIPARCGSKGIPGKNIRPFAGKPLLAWSVEAAKNSRYITETVLSSDCDEILEVGERYGVKPLKRPKELATDSAPSEPLILDAIERLERKGKVFDYLVLLQPTSPLREAEDIDRAIDSMLKADADAAISVYEPTHSPYKAFVKKSDGFLEGIVDNDKPFMRRQDLPPVYFTNGAIYIIKTAIFKREKRLFCERTIPYIMPVEKSIDIDSIEDFEKAEMFIESKEGS